MKTLNTLFFVLFLINANIFAYNVVISASESDAKIFVNGQLMGYGNLKVKIPKNTCSTILVMKVGFLNHMLSLCNDKLSPKPQRNYHFNMKRDDAFDASIQTDIANVDIQLNTHESEDKTWKMISQIITSYFDIIEITDRDSGYLRTAWVSKRFVQNTIRTRVIVKLASTEPLGYKIKLVSEESGLPLTSVKQDELFVPWDRVLKYYEDMMIELQNRIS